MSLTAATLQPEVMFRWKEATGLTIMEGFGQTEGSCCVRILYGIRRPGSMGRPCPLYNLDIIDDNDQSCRPVPKAASSLPALTRDSRSDSSADITVTMQRQKKLCTTVTMRRATLRGAMRTATTVCRRSDDVIKCSGYRIGPFEVESALQSHKAVLECAITSAPIRSADRSSSYGRSGERLHSVRRSCKRASESREACDSAVQVSENY
jgi:acetyl-CoA synthetase